MKTITLDDRQAAELERLARHFIRYSPGGWFWNEVLAILDAAPPAAPIVIHGHVSDIFDDTDAGEGVSIDGGHDGGYVIIEWKRHGLKNGDRVAVEVRRMGDDS